MSHEQNLLYSFLGTIDSFRGKTFPEDLHALSEDFIILIHEILINTSYDMGEQLNISRNFPFINRVKYILV